MRITVGPKSKGKQVYEHRAKAGVADEQPGKGAKKVVDHKNRNPSDNRKSNLRVVSRSENNRNR